MNAKEKKPIKITLKNIITFLVSMLILFDVVLFYYYYFGKNNVYAKQSTFNAKETKISQAQLVDLEPIIAQNAKEGKIDEYKVEETTLEYLTKYRNNANLPKGKIQVIQEGREGKQLITTKKTYQNNELISEEQVSCKMTKASVDKIVEVGTGNESRIYQVKVGDTLYVTSDRLSVRVNPDEQAKKVATLKKENQLKVLEIQGDWYKISCASTIGYVKAEGTTYIDPMPKQETQELQVPTSQASPNKQQFISRVSFDMALNNKSGLTLEQFKEILTDKKDTNKIFENNAQYFYYIEEQYKINGVFVAAVGIHESAWGTSKIAKDKNNLFGYGAYDSNPYHGAYEFSNYSESIDLIARVFVKYYIQPKGTSIYGGEKAEGTYYNGPTLSGINIKYATDKNWANGVFQHMKYLYNKL